MIERVYIETEETVDAVQEALGDAISVGVAQGDGEPQGYPRKLTADVPDSRDAEEEVTEKLNAAGIDAYVYT